MPSEIIQLTGERPGGSGATGIFPLRLGGQIPLPSAGQQSQLPVPGGQLLAEQVGIRPRDLCDRQRVAARPASIGRARLEPLRLGAFGLRQIEAAVQQYRVQRFVAVAVLFIRKTSHGKIAGRNPSQSQRHVIRGSTAFHGDRNRITGCMRRNNGGSNGGDALDRV